MGQRYGQRPSAWVPGVDPALALSLDIACMGAGDEALDETLRRSGGGIQPVRIVGGG